MNTQALLTNLTPEQEEKVTGGLIIAGGILLAGKALFLYYKYGKIAALAYTAYKTGKAIGSNWR